MKKLPVAFAVLVGVLAVSRAHAQEPFAAARNDFNKTCAVCHGDGGGGGDRAPALADNPDLRRLDAGGIAAIIRRGMPGGMPAFASLPQAQVTQIATWLKSMNESALRKAPPEQVAAGEKFFFGGGGCSGCHMVRGRGESKGPDLSGIGARTTLKEINAWLDNPTSQMGIKTLAVCPFWAFCPDFQWAIADVALKDGGHLRGYLRGQTEHEVQILDMEGKLHLLDASRYTSVTREPQSAMPVLHATADQRRDLLAYLSSLAGVEEGPLTTPSAPITQADIDQIMKPKRGDWPSYNGGLDGNRWSALDRITTANVKNLQPQFVFAPGGSGLEGTPVVIGDVMYVTGGTRVCALNARTGAPIWCSARNNGIASTPKSAPAPVGPNRGVAVLGDRVFYISDDAYLVCLNRLTGAVMWSVWLPEKGAAGKFYSSMAPMVVGDQVVAGIAGGDSPMRGFLAAYHPDSGKLAWRFYTIPKPGEPLAKTWIGRALTTGGGATWSTGSYDAETGTLYWAVGNPYPDTDPDERGGRNLYTNSVIALDARTGTFKWHFQFTPYDTHDWDATQPLVLADANWKGQPRKLLLSAQRSGVFYVIDRTNGQFLLAKPFVKKETWSRGFEKDGTPIMVAGNTPTVDGTITCPGVRGATNWYAQSFDPQTGLFYVMAAEDCGIYRKTGKIFGPNPDPADVGTRLVRALNIQTGDVTWEKLLVGPQETNYTGVLTTAGGLLFHGETGGDFAAVDAKTGQTLWTFRANDSWRASPMTYMVDGRQYVAAMDSTNLFSFALPN
ncbi:MAG TPA: PQQ-binding-like beta-propeller repeat protein [Rhizomicrobium sp.]|nr:PQQ-binding-like beta-propeller repeat protein [Rhizomicrobium sp.]